jgi:hypothetical protein
MLYGDGSRRAGLGQLADLHLGLSATLTPLYLGPTAPYLVLGAAAVQRWENGTSYYTDGTPSTVAAPVQSYAFTRGEIAGIVGLGMRVRLAHRVVRLEARYFLSSAHMSDVTVGSSLRF